MLTSTNFVAQGPFEPRQQSQRVSCPLQLHQPRRTHMHLHDTQQLLHSCREGLASSLHAAMLDRAPACMT